MPIINVNSRLEEGLILNKYMKKKFDANKNILAGISGSTGSGKTYIALRTCELWYKFWFNEEYPIKNVCFSVGELMRRLSSGEMREGDILILEEAGVNLGSSDWQIKVVKMFNYVLQSFRSMNVGVIMTLPVLTMLAKQARQLLHFQLITQGIDFRTNTSKAKCLFHQLNQMSGKSYWKYMRIRYMGKNVAVERMGFSLPSEKLRNEYEAKKIKFVSDLTNDFSAELDKIELDKAQKTDRSSLTKHQNEIYEYIELLGHTQAEAARHFGISQPTAGQILKAAKNKIKTKKIKANFLGKSQK